MHTFLSAATLVLACAFAPALPQLDASTNVQSAEGDDAGFQQAVFSAEALQELMADASVMGIRFYNVMAAPGDATGSVMAVGIVMDGSERNSGKSYLMDMGLRQGQFNVVMVAAANATKYCRNMSAAGHASYSAAFTRTDIEALLDQEGCTGLMVTPATVDKGLSMQITAMKMEGERAVALGSGSAYQRQCGFPCPSVCGPKKNYVNM